MSAQRVYLVRHGSTAWQAAGRYCGHRDVPLTDVGRAQVDALRRRFTVPSGVVAVCSDLSRARETARILAPGLAWRICPALREVNFGAWEGLTYAETGHGDPERLRDPEFCFAGGESGRGLQARLHPAVDALLVEAEDALLLVAHQGSLAATALHLLQQPWECFWDYRLPPAGIAELQRVGGVWHQVRGDWNLV